MPSSDPFEMMIETFSMVAGMKPRSVRSLPWSCLSFQMQPRGLGIPAILAAIFAGPLGKS